MKHFMGNNCGFGNCLSSDCEKCGHYKPTCFGIKVPVKMASLLYKLEHKLLFRKYKFVGDINK